MTPLIAASKTPLEKALPHEAFRLPFGEEGIPVSNHLVMATVAAVIVVILAKWMSGKINPAGKTQAADFVTRGRFAQLIETLCEFIYYFVAKPQLKHLTDKYIPYIWTIFFFTLTCNLLGLIPFPYIIQLVSMPFVGVEASYEMKSVFGGTATSNLAVNAPLAIVSFVAILYIGIKETGFKHFVNHFNPIGWDDKALLPIGLMLFVIEWLGLFIKCTVLALRLLGTMFAGHLVLYVLVDLIFQASAAMGSLGGYAVGVPMVILSVGIFLLEIFVAFLQAFIFTFLTTLFIAMTAVSHDHDHEEEHDPSMGEVLADPSEHGHEHVAPATA